MNGIVVSPMGSTTAPLRSLAHSCREFFPVVDMAKDFSGAVVLPIGYTTMNVSIHYYNAGVLVLLDTLPLQLTPCRNYYPSKTIYFWEGIHKKKIISVKTNTAEHFGVSSQRDLE